jgi:8-oxo-dGTP diphosphatase
LGSARRHPRARRTFEQGVVREVAEETGVTVEVERLTGVYKNMSQGIVALVYRCRPITGGAHPTSESVAVDWMSVSRVTELLTPAYAVRVLDALRLDVASRAHDGYQVLEAEAATSGGAPAR